MADVSKIQIGSTTYNIKDSTARTGLDSKAPLASPALTGNPTAPTQSTSNNSTRLATTEFVQKHAPIYITCTAQQGTTVTVNDERITSSMRVVGYGFVSARNIRSSITWTTANGSITLTSKFTGSTTIYLILEETN